MSDEVTAAEVMGAARTEAGLDAIEALVRDSYPKGTQDPLGKALRHQLHKLGRLVEPEYEHILLVPVGVRPGSKWTNSREALDEVKSYVAEKFAFSEVLTVLDGGDYFRHQGEHKVLLTQLIDPRRGVVRPDEVKTVLKDGTTVE